MQRFEFSSRSLVTLIQIYLTFTTGLCERYETTASVSYSDCNGRTTVVTCCIRNKVPPTRPGGANIHITINNNYFRKPSRINNNYNYQEPPRKKKWHSRLTDWKQQKGAANRGLAKTRGTRRSIYSLKTHQTQV